MVKGWVIIGEDIRQVSAMWLSPHSKLNLITLILYLKEMHVHCPGSFLEMHLLVMTSAVELYIEVLVSCCCGQLIFSKFLQYTTFNMEFS